MLADLDEELNAAGTSLVFAELKDPVRAQARALRADRPARSRPLLPDARRRAGDASAVRPAPTGLRPSTRARSRLTVSDKPPHLIRPGRVPLSLRLGPAARRGVRPTGIACGAHARQATPRRRPHSHPVIADQSPGWDDASLLDGLHDPRTMFSGRDQAGGASAGFASLARRRSVASRSGPRLLSGCGARNHPGSRRFGLPWILNRRRPALGPVFTRSHSHEY